MRMPKILISACLLFAWTATQILAQPSADEAPAETAKPTRWTIGVGGGLLATADAPSGSFTFDHDQFGSEPGTFDAAWDGGDASLYELSISLRLRNRWGLGLTFSEASLDDAANITGRLPHPFLFEKPRTVEGKGRNLYRDEAALHLSLKWLLRDTEKVQVALFAGPSRIDLDHDLLSAVDFSQTYPFDEATYAGVLKRRESGSAIGYHAGIDVARYWNDRTGVGGLLRWSSASIDLDAPNGGDNGSVTVDASGLQVVVDLRFRF